MHSSNEITLKEAIEQLLKAYKLEDKILETKLISSWESVTGKVIVKHTKHLYIRKKKLFVKLDSPALKNELIYSRQQLLDLLNKEVGSKVIDEIIFI
jgi:predicted nucleic acid-binding Zn ribbon protein